MPLYYAVGRRVHFSQVETPAARRGARRMVALIESDQILANSKVRLCREMEQDADPTIVWQPMSEAGFGASPFNPNCWRRTDGSPILSQEVWRTVSKDLKVMRGEIYKK